VSEPPALVAEPAIDLPPGHAACVFASDPGAYPLPGVIVDFGEDAAGNAVAEVVRPSLQ
jgi:hypothetical protein